MFNYNNRVDRKKILSSGRPPSGHGRRKHNIINTPSIAIRVTVNPVSGPVKYVDELPDSILRVTCV